MRLDAKSDGYETPRNTALNIAAPGVLSNDLNLTGGVMTAEFRTSPPPTPPQKPLNGPYHGVVAFHSNGSFEYTPDTDYVGSDWFYYRAVSTTGQVTPWARVTITVGRAMIRQCAACTCNSRAVAAGVNLYGFLPFVNTTSPIPGGGGIYRTDRYLTKRLVYTNSAGPTRYDATITVDRLNGWWTYVIDPSTNTAHPGLGTYPIGIGDQLRTDDPLYPLLYTNIVITDSTFSADFNGSPTEHVEVTMGSLRSISDAKLDLDTLMGLEDAAAVPLEHQHSWTYGNLTTSFLPNVYIWPGQIGSPGFKDSTPAMTDSLLVHRVCAAAYLYIPSTDTTSLSGRKVVSHAVGDLCEQLRNWEWFGAATTYECTNHPNPGGVCGYQIIAIAMPDLVVVDDYRIRNKEVTLTPDSVRTAAGPQATPCCP